MKQVDEHQIEQVREICLTKELVIIDGQPGCGKTLFPSILATLERVEMMSYAFPVEWICMTHALGNMDLKTATTLTRMFVDQHIYQSMMGRETNFRISDLSSVWKSPNSWKYIRRIFEPGDKEIPDKILKERPILNLTTHYLMAFAEPLLNGFGGSVTILEIVRHPLYMLRQHKINMKELINNPRDINIYYKMSNDVYPFYARGWEEDFKKLNETEKAIVCFQKMTEKIDAKRKYYVENYNSNIITIPFERFVLSPDRYLKDICEKLKTRMTKLTKNELKKQKVPRNMIADGINLKVYKRYGWEPAKSKDENEELRIRRNEAVAHCSKDVIDILDKICTDYENKYLNDLKIGGYNLDL